MQKAIIGIVCAMCLAFAAFMLYFLTNANKVQKDVPDQVAAVNPKPDQRPATRPKAIPDSPPQQETPRPEQKEPERETPKQDPPKQDTEPPKQDAPKQQQGDSAQPSPGGDNPPGGAPAKKPEADKPPPEPETEPSKAAGTPTPKGASPDVGNIVPEIDGADVDGKKFKLSDYRGKVVLLDFWGFW